MIKTAILDTFLAILDTFKIKSGHEKCSIFKGLRAFWTLFHFFSYIYKKKIKIFIRIEKKVEKCPRR